MAVWIDTGVYRAGPLDRVEKLKLLETFEKINLVMPEDWIAVVNGRVDRHGCLSGSRVEKLKLLETFKNKLRHARRHSYHIEQV